jgi:putative PIN family toxin of toxin-antitoxin system
MRQVVIDTNVLISATLSPLGKPAHIMSLVSFKELQLYYCEDILDEYKRALAYKRLKIPVSAQNKAIAGIAKLGVLVSPPTASTIAMPDESDRIFYDIAQANKAFLITGTTKHFPAKPTIITPADFLEYDFKEANDNFITPVRMDKPPKYK